MAGCRCGWLLTYTAALPEGSRYHAASISAGFASDLCRTHRHPNQPRNFSALRRYVGRIRSSLQSRCQPINKFLRPAAFVQRTGKTTFAGLRSVRLRGKRSRLWCRRQDSNLRLSELALYATIRPSSTAEVRLHEGGAGLSRLSPLRVGCLRLAPIGTRFCFLLALYPRKPVPACTSPERWIWCRRLDSNQRHTSWRGALPTELRLRMGAAPYPALAARRKPRSLMALGGAI